MISFIVGSLSIPAVVSCKVPQMSRLRQVFFKYPSQSLFLFEYFESWYFNVVKNDEKIYVQNIRDPNQDLLRLQLSMLTTLPCRIHFEVETVVKPLQVSLFTGF